MGLAGWRLENSFPSAVLLQFNPWLAFGIRKYLILKQLAVTVRSPQRRLLWLQMEVSRPSIDCAWNN